MESYTIYLAYKDRRVPWYAKILIFCIIGYLFSPVDRFLDSIPIIGYLDHLILVPIGVVLVFKKMIPASVFPDCREKARIAMNRKKPINWVTGPIFIFIWFLFAILAIFFITVVMKDWGSVLKWWSGWFIKMTTLKNHMPAHGGV
jgi:uncharacterized membrane protein YkvA (DUF1232 family)